jgi:hyperosmotically inducible periplasmic protein
MKQVSILTIVIILLISLGCATSGWRGEEVKEKLSRSRSLGAHQVNIDERTQGVVILTGKVSSDQDRAEIERIAHSTNGVREVQNQLVVAPSSIVVREGSHPLGYDPRQQSQFSRSDAEINREVREVLTRSRDVDLRNVYVDTKDGIVTLRGSQSLYQQSQRLVALASTIEGVRAVRNEMTIGDGRYSRIPQFTGSTP